MLFQLALLASTVIANGELRKIKVHHTPAALLARQVDQFCSTGNDCATCFGAGNILCSSNTCFNPSGGEQCCATGEYCIRPINCCDDFVSLSLFAFLAFYQVAIANLPLRNQGGPGVTGVATSPSATVNSVTSTPSVSTSPSLTVSSESAAPTEWDCLADDSDEECCARGGQGWAWCAGTAPTRVCYRPSVGQSCCSDGTSCVGAGCCNDNVGTLAHSEQFMQDGNRTLLALLPATGSFANTFCPSGRHCHHSQPDYGFIRGSRHLHRCPNRKCLTP